MLARCCLRVPHQVRCCHSHRVYVKFALSSEASKCKEMMDGRLFDDNKVGPQGAYKGRACSSTSGLRVMGF